MFFKEKNQWISGKNALKEAIATGQLLQKVFLNENLEKETLYELLKLCRKQHIPVVQVPKFKLDKLSKSNHQGVLGLINPIEFWDPEDLIQQAFDQGKNPGLLYLDGLTDVRNFGAICRTAEVFGLTGVMMGQKNAAPINEEAIKASAGALLRLPIVQLKDPGFVLKKLKRQGMTIIACSEKAELPVSKAELGKSCVLVLGSEGTGIQNSILDLCDELISIPQAGEIQSLNVSIAAGIICYEWMNAVNKIQNG
ncbi:MAG TPA: 23S rRNA (guanosine(2251)-2'-O)-methyltransferase RlmB [Saprospiraceae bacterium]|nr:23S rRNA (guanosine(2251)-2'-O)-methyltransferase RlmB [Saprospiraceae bacterium]